MNRDQFLARAQEQRRWDVLVIGGGATGVGVAVDAASRGYSVLLAERGDFGVGTSSRSTKLVHGGVRYLRQGNVRLVLDALRERGLLRKNAPHVVHDLPFVLPCYSRWDKLQYGVGLTLYDLLAGRSRFGRSRVIAPREVTRLLPTVRNDGLRGGVVYYDGQFDDARLLIHLVRTASDLGATVLNYAPVVNLLKRDGRVEGAVLRDAETGAEWPVNARVVVNATGPYCDQVRRMAEPAATPMVAASRGSHVVLPRSFLPTDHALLIPETPDGRVLFAIPWHGHTLVGTTDVAVPEASPEPRASDAEIDFILETAGRYLAKPPTRADILSTFAGIRPLVKSDGKNTAALSRDHTIRVEGPGLITITGGKWTTYREMAEDCVDQAAKLAGLPKKPCRTRTLRVHGYHERMEQFGDLAEYGTDALEIQNLMRSDPALGTRMHPELPYRPVEVVWAVRHEMARTVEDVLTRRLRAMHLNARAAIGMAPSVAAVMAEVLGHDDVWRREQVAAFTALAQASMA